MGLLDPLFPITESWPVLPGEWGEQLGDAHAEAVCETPDDVEARASLAPLNVADVRPMQVRPFRKLFLGNAQTITKLSDAAAERYPQVFHESDREQNGRT